MLAYFAMMLVEKHWTRRSIFVDVVALYRAGLRGYHGTLLLFTTSLHKSIVPCGGTGLQRYAVPSLLN